MIVALLSVLLLFAILGIAFCAFLIDNYWWQFDMKLSHLEMTRLVRTASIALALLAVTGIVENGLDHRYGFGNWRKVKGIANVQLATGEIVEAELHWYEAHGIGKRRIKIKRFVP